jgi:hypothetical protein
VIEIGVGLQSSQQRQPVRPREAERVHQHTIDPKSQVIAIVSGIEVDGRRLFRARHP